MNFHEATSFWTTWWQKPHSLVSSVLTKNVRSHGFHPQYRANQVWWCTIVMPAVRISEAEGRLPLQSRSRQPGLHEMFSSKIKENKRSKICGVLIYSIETLVLDTILCWEIRVQRFSSHTHTCTYTHVHTHVYTHTEHGDGYRRWLIWQLALLC